MNLLFCSNKNNDMKKQTLSTLSKRLVVASVTTLALATVIVSSCTKKSDSSPNYSAQFIGTWSGTTNCAGKTGTGTLTLAAGSGTNSLTNSGTCGTGSCVKPITVNGTASANGFVFPVQTFTDGCGLSYTITYVATLSGGTLTSTETATGAVNATCTFTGTKQ